MIRRLMNVDKLAEWELAEETDVLGENLPQRHFVYVVHILKAS
jgi:hypothetical protein